MGKHSTPCTYVQVRPWCRQCNPPGEARFAVPPRRGAGRRWLPGGPARPRLGPLPCPHPAGWRGPYGRPGLGEAGQAAPRRAPAVPCSPGLTAGPRRLAEVPRGVREGSGAGRNGVARHSNTTAGHSPLLDPASGGAPVPSRGRRSPAESAAAAPASSRSGIHRQESRSLPEQDLHLGEVRSRGKSGGARACV